MLRIWIRSLVLLVAGCGPFSSLEHLRTENRQETGGESANSTVAAPPSAEEAVPDLPFHELIPRIGQEPAQNGPPARPHTWYGTWVCDRGSTRTWIRIERPLVHVVAIDKKTNASWVMDGRYSVANNGMMYGVMTACDKASGDPERARALLEGDERVLRGRRPEKKLMPFSCRVSLRSLTLPAQPSLTLPAHQDELTIADFRGTCFEGEREQFLHGRYQQTSLGRPGVAVPGAPLGIWVNEGRDRRVVVVLQPDRFELQLSDRLGRRINLAGSYDVGDNGVVFGVITSVEHGRIGKVMAHGQVTPQVLCFRYGFRGNMMVIDEVRSLGLARQSEECLLGGYRPPLRH